MKIDDVLRVQSYVDGELTAAERTQVDAFLAKNPEARELCEGLRAAKAILVDGELVREVPALRDDYWRGISRRIQREDQPKVSIPWLDRVRLLWSVGSVRWASATFAVAILLALAGLALRTERQWAAFPGPQEIESMPQDEGVADISFVSESAGMSVVWIAQRFDY